MYIWQASEIYSSYGPTFEMETVHNTTLTMKMLNNITLRDILV